MTNPARRTLMLLALSALIMAGTVIVIAVVTGIPSSLWVMLNVWLQATAQ